MSIVLIRGALLPQPDTLLLLLILNRTEVCIVLVLERNMQ